jgi:hypothetical protein
MAQLREQMKDKTRRLQSEYKDLSKGIHSTTDDAKLRAMEEQHRELLGKTSDTFRLVIFGIYNKMSKIL